MIKVVNKRKCGSMFHYAHFICDCLFPEIINDIYQYEEVFREKNIHQTIGNFDKIYTEVMKTKNNEIMQEEFNKLNVEILIYKNKEDYLDKIYFEKFRNFIFQRYDIDFSEYNPNYPEIILIKRGDRINLIDDEYLESINHNITSGKERREIHEIDKIENYLINKYEDKFKSLFFEHVSFQEQVNYFANAKIIICAHGAVMSNMFFCKEHTTIIEVTCKMNWVFFDHISKISILKHIKCVKNEYDDIIRCIEMHCPKNI